LSAMRRPESDLDEAYQDNRPFINRSVATIAFDINVLASWLALMIRLRLIPQALFRLCNRAGNLHSIGTCMKPKASRGLKSRRPASYSRLEAFPLVCILCAALNNLAQSRPATMRSVEPRHSGVQIAQKWFVRASFTS
jgi:hypothetical protein